MANIVKSNAFVEIAKVGRANPDALQRMQIQFAEGMVKGDVVLNNAGTPFNNIFEMNAVMTAMLTRENIAQLSNIYPSLASREDEVAKHMSSRDFIGRWSFPSQTEFCIGLPLQDIINNAVDVRDGSGTKMLTIPGASAFTVSNTVFTMQYPINIRVMSHGSITVEYDTRLKSPIYTPTSSRINNTWINEINNVKMLYIPFPIYQIEIASQSASIAGSAGWKQTYDYKDLFFMARCYRSVGKGEWQEVDVTYSDVTYDATKPTVVMSVDPLNKKLTAEIPQIYLTNGLLRNQIRIDIYTTEGELELSLENFTSGSFTAVYKDPDVSLANDPLGFNSRMGMFGTIYLDAREPTSGGHNGLSFGELRNRVIHRSTHSEGPPITSLQVSNQFTDSGFSKTNVIDNITNRTFLATRDLPKPTIPTEAVATTDTLPFAVSGMGAVVVAQNTTLSALALNDTVIDNGERLTVLPSTLYELVNGQVNVVPDAYVKQITNPSITPVDRLANLVNARNFYYTPFFYVHDIGGNEYSIRTYALANPQVIRKYAVADNDTLGINSTVSAYSVELMPDYSGWRYLFELNNSEDFSQMTPDQVNFQMSYFDPNSKYRTIFNSNLLSPIDATTGRPVNDRYVFEVIIPTNWDVNRTDKIKIGTGTSMAPLESDWDLVVFLKNWMPVGATNTVVDDTYNATLLPNFDPGAKYVGLFQEQLNMNLGYNLDRLWKRANSTIEPWMYKRYTENVPALYSQTVYKTVEGTGDPILVMNDTGTALTQVVIHKEGDPVLDHLGKPEYEHYKGDLVKDPITKEPIIVEGVRGINRNFDLVLLDGKYYFTTSDSVLSYITSSRDTLVEWNNGIIRRLATTLETDTRLYYHPKATTGLIKAYVGDGNLVTLEADQKLYINFIVPNHVYRNSTLRRNIKVSVIQAVEQYFNDNSTLSVSELMNVLRGIVGQDQVGLEIKGLFNDEYEAITVAFDSGGPSIGKRVVTDSSLAITIQDAIDIDFTKHRAATLQ